MNKYLSLAITMVILTLAALSLRVMQYYTEASIPVLTEDQKITNFVEEFGSKIKNVSLLASNAPNQMKKQYGPYVTSDLLRAWQAKPTDAPGRETSSPWPESLNVVSITPVNRVGDTFDVEGNVLLGVNGEKGIEPVGVYSVSLFVEKKKNAPGYIITSYTRGAYSELPKRQTIVGFFECLPQKNAPSYKIEPCTLGIARDQSDGHYALDTSLLSKYPVDFATGTKLQVTGVVTPANQLSSIRWQQLDIDGIISVTEIKKL
jgi:hypothetical protein